MDRPYPAVGSGSESPQIRSEGYLVGSGGWMPTPPSPSPSNGQFDLKFRLYRQKPVVFTLISHTILRGLDGCSTPRKCFFGLFGLIDAHFWWWWTMGYGHFKSGENMKSRNKVIKFSDMWAFVIKGGPGAGLQKRAKLFTLGCPNIQSIFSQYSVNHPKPLLAVSVFQRALLEPQRSAMSRKLSEKAKRAPTTNFRHSKYAPACILRTWKNESRTFVRSRIEL